MQKLYSYCLVLYQVSKSSRSFSLLEWRLDVAARRRRSDDKDAESRNTIYVWVWEGGWRGRDVSQSGGGGAPVMGRRRRKSRLKKVKSYYVCVCGYYAIR